MSPFEDPNVGLLPSGFIDLLQHEAEAEARGIETVMEVFGAHGYERVRPPLCEFEASLLLGSGEALTEQTFRLMDPDSRRMMALRPDMTTQIARIAATRLADRPRPLRLSYTGTCVVLGTPGREAERQITQAGIELIGIDSALADAEVVLVAAEALSRLDIAHVSFDLSCPALAQAVIDTAGLPLSRRAQLAHAVDRKDAAAVAELGGAMAPVLTALMEAAGPATSAFKAIEAIDLPSEARRHAERLIAVAHAIADAAPDLRLTVDPVEFRGWQYHTGVCMTVFARSVREELGRGGRYLAHGSEPACGLTLRPEALLRAARPIELRTRVYVPHGISAGRAQALRAEGFATVAGLAPVADPASEARRLDCLYVASNNDLTSL